MLNINNVSKIYGGGTTRVTALNSISLTVDDGAFVSIMGASGSGKSTLLNIIGGLEKLSSGEIHINGERIDNLDENAMVKVRRGKLAYVFQQYHLLPSLTAMENVLLPLVLNSNAKNTDNKEEKARLMLKKVGLEKRADHKPSEMSGGEQQRVAIARALVTSPSLILADEPTGNMDKKTGDEIMELFDQLHHEGHSIVMVTHNPETAKHTGKTVILQDGQIIQIVQNNVGGTA
jgi:putative ABC transport system ATP-binding protein